MWKKWEFKLREFEKWRTERRTIFGLRHGEFLLKEFFSEIPVSSRKGAMCLEIGCGGGGILCPVVKTKFFIGIGVDPILDSSLKVLKSRVHNEGLSVHPLRGVGEHLPLRNSTVETVIIAAALDHVADPSKVFEESNRVLSEDGDFLLLQIITKEEKTDFRDRTHLRQFTTEELYNLFYENNFEVKKTRFFYNIQWRPLHVLKLLPQLYDFVGKLIHNPLIVVIRAKKSTCRQTNNRINNSQCATDFSVT